VDRTDARIALSFDACAMYAAEPFTLSRASELRDIHRALETLGAQSWADRADEQALDRLWEAFGRVQRYVETDAGTDLVRLAKDAFFRALFEGAGRSIVPESLRRVEHRMRVVRAASLATPGRPAEMLEELAAILAAATARDTRALTQACAEHLDREFASGVRVLTGVTER